MINSDDFDILGATTEIDAGRCKLSELMLGGAITLVKARQKEDGGQKVEKAIELLSRMNPDRVPFILGLAAILDRRLQERFEASCAEIEGKGMNAGLAQIRSFSFLVSWLESQMHTHDHIRVTTYHILHLSVEAVDHLCSYFKLNVHSLTYYASFETAEAPCFRGGNIGFSRSPALLPEEIDRYRTRKGQKRIDPIWIKIFATAMNWDLSVDADYRLQCADFVLKTFQNKGMNYAHYRSAKQLCGFNDLALLDVLSTLEDAMPI